MSDFLQYQLKKARKDAAYERYNFASAALRNAEILERLAEIKSQHEPLGSLGEKQLTERDRLYSAAHYVVTGRLPEQEEENNEPK